MQRAVGAVLYHYSQANDLAAQHQFCPQGSTSWCKYQADITDGTQTYVHKTGLPVHVRNKIAPIFQDLSSKDLLRKCLHGTTQNNNEALNGIIWLKCPKEVYVERFTLELGVCSAILNFNSGTKSIINVLEDSGVTPGYFTTKYCSKQDMIRVSNSNRKSTDASKVSRQKRHARRKGLLDTDKETDGLTYGAGKF